MTKKDIQKAEVKQMKQSLKKLLSALLVLTLLVQILPAAVFATEEEAALPEAGLSNDELLLTDAGTLAADAGEDSKEILFEETSLREENVKHFRMSDGTSLAVDYQQPVHYAADNGNWEDIDNRLIATRNTSNETIAYTSAIGAYQKTFAADLSACTLFSVSDGEYQIVMGLPETEKADAETDVLDAAAADIEGEGMQEVAPAAQVFLNEELSAEEKKTASLEEQTALPNLSASVVYEDAMQGADLHYESIGYDIKESIVVSAPQTDYRYCFTLSLTNLTAQMLSDGSISLRSGEEERYYIPAPYMVDANEAYSEAASYALEDIGNGDYLLTVTADSEWLNAEERAFPVQIDPTLCKRATTSNSVITNSFIRSASPDSTSLTNGFVYCGKSTSANASDSVMGALQSYFYISALPTLPVNSRVVSSYLSLYHSGYHGSGELIIRAFELTGAPSSGTYSDWIKSFTWNNHSAHSATMLDAVNLTSSTLYEYVNWDITKAVLKWYKSGSNNKGITLEANNAMNLTAYASFGGYAHSANKPVFYVVYRNAVGIEPYYTYQTQSAGQAGTGYVSDNNLQLTLLRTDLSAGSTVNSFSLTHVYNSAYAGNQFTDGNVGIQTKDYTKMVLGAGWKLNVQETVRKCTLADTAATYYVYHDADGTEHYFYYDSAKGCYRDEDGLNLSLSISGTTFTIADEKNNKCIFYNGYLSEICDANGNAIYIAYNESSGHTLSDFSPTATSWRPAASGNQITSVYRKNDGGSVEWLVSFTWDSANRLSSVTDKIKSKTTYFYYTTDSGVVYLTGISAAGSTAYRARYVYDTEKKRMKEAYDVEAKRGIEYTYKGHTLKVDVYRMAEYYAPSYSGTKTYGAKVRAYQFEPYSTSYRYYGDDRITADDPSGAGSTAEEDDLLTVFYFDALGRTVNTVGYHTDRAKLLGGSVTSFTQNNGTSSKNNRVVAQAGAGMFYANMLKDSSFEACPVGLGDIDVPPWGLTNNGGSVAFYKNTPHYGEVYAALENTKTPTASTSYQAGLYQTVTLQANQTYCFSAYLRIDQSGEEWSYGNAYLYFANSSGTILSKGDEIAFDTGEIENGWMRVYVTYTPSVAGSYRVGACLYNVMGTVGIDDLQLELGAAPNSYNLLRDSSLEFYDSWDSYEGWTLSGSAAIAETTDTIDGENAIQLSGHTGLDRYAYQDVLVSEDYRTTYLLSGWANAPSLPFVGKETYTASDRFFGLKAKIYYADNSTEDTYIPFNCYCEDWQYVCGVVVPKQQKTVSKIRVYADYSHNAGTAYFDDIALTKEPVQTYSYDENGKVKAATDTGEEQTYTFDGADLTQYTGSSGTFTFEYDSCHNLKKATNDGVSMTMTYDAAGNMLTSKLTNTKDSKYLQSSATYSADKNTVLTSTDVNGSRTSYTYTMGTLPLSVTDAKNHKTTYAYDSDLRNSAVKYYASTTDTAAIAELYYTYSSGSLSQLRRKTGTSSWHHLYIDADIWGNTTAIRINGSTSGTAGGTGLTLTENTYEANNGKLQSQKYGNGGGREYSYDLLDRLVETRYYENYGTTSKRLTKTVYNAYNGLGYLTETGTKGADGKITEKYVFEYDSLGRLIRSVEYAYTYSGSTVTCEMVQRTEHSYDTENRLSSQSWVIGDTDYSESYTYSKADGSLTELKNNTGSISYAYDNLKRLERTTATNSNGAAVFNTAYAYRTVSGSQTSAQVEFRNVRLGSSASDTPIEGKKYSYDSMGNITLISQSTGSYYPLVAYAYDSQNQLRKETYYDGKGTGSAHVTDIYEYTYDAAGNLTEKKNGLTAQTYSYADNTWNDLLTSYDGEKIAYEGQKYTEKITPLGVSKIVTGTATSGNPISYYNGKRWNFAWESGRNLAQSKNTTVEQVGSTPAGKTENELTVDYAYDADGIRSGKTVINRIYKYRLSGSGGGEIMTAGVVVPQPTYQKYLYSITTTQHKYVTQNGKVVRETIGSGSSAKVLDFIYDESGRPFALKYSTNGGSSFKTYYYVLNLQGDVVKLVEILADDTGAWSYGEIANYEYDAWGNVLSVTDERGDAITDSTHLAHLNPLRYRGYYYDRETGFYYLQSRYYDPATHRFINADSFASTDIDDPVAANMFAYCNNNPVNLRDDTGDWGWSTLVNAVVGGVVSAVCTWATGGSLADVAESFVVGAVEGALSDGIPIVSTVVKTYHAIDTYIDCRSSGASVGESLLCAGLSYGASSIYGSTNDTLTNAAVDLTFGLGASLISESVSTATQNRNKNATVASQNTYTTATSYRGGGGSKLVVNVHMMF